MRAGEFLEDYFRSRTDVYRCASPFFAEHSRQFFDPAYLFFDHEQSIAESEAEKIISVKESDGHAEIITTGFTKSQMRLRYQLAASAESWKIAVIELECGICHGSGKAKDGKSDCKFCKGAGWRPLGKTKAA